MMSNIKNKEMKSEDRADAPVATDGEESRRVPTDTTTTVQARGKRKAHLLTFALTMIVAWGLGTYAYIYFFPHILYNALERAIVQRGIGATTNGGNSSGIPVNTLFAMPALASPSTLKSNLLEGTNHDTLYAVGWLDLSKEGSSLTIVTSNAENSIAPRMFKS